MSENSQNEELREVSAATADSIAEPTAGEEEVTVVNQVFTQ